MILTATKIYLLTNAIFLAGLSFISGHIGLGLLAAPFSLAYTAPLIVFMSILLWTLNRLSAVPLASWLIFLAGITGFTYLPFYIIDRGDELHVLPTAYASAFISILFLCRPIHRHFLPRQSLKSNVKREPWSA